MMVLSGSVDCNVKMPIVLECGDMEWNTDQAWSGTLTTYRNCGSETDIP